MKVQRNCWYSKSRDYT